MRLFALFAVTLFTLTGCVTVNLPDVPPYHPASAQAETGAIAPSPPVLNLGSTQPEASPGLPVPGGMAATPSAPGSTEEDHGTMQGMQHPDQGASSGGAAPAPEGSHQGQVQPPSGAVQHDAHAEPTPLPKATDAAKDGKVQYTCPMHPEVVSDRPGKCPKCGMTLVRKQVS